MNTTSPNAEPADDDERGVLLSALADGDAAALQRGCALWRDDAQARATWHAYHLIGDVLRSEDLAAPAARDAAFLAALRERLAAEPVVLAPVAAKRRAGWSLPMAAAASFVVVAGVVSVARLPAGGGAGAVVAVSRPSSSPLTLASSAAPPPSSLVIEGRFIRDARLDSYLRAHRDAAGSGGLTLPGGPRSVEAMAPVMPAVAPVAR